MKNSKETWFSVIVMMIVVLLFIAFIYEFAFNTEFIHETPPPGWHIEKSHIGFAWVDNDGYRSISIKDNKQDAIKNAWRQHEHSKERENLIWVPVEIGEENEP